MKEEIQCEVWQDQKPPTLEKLQELVGGYIEVIPINNIAGHKQCQLIINEEGSLYGLPVNRDASIIAKREIVGNAVILTGDNKLT